MSRRRARDASGYTISVPSELAALRAQVEQLNLSLGAVPKLDVPTLEDFEVIFIADARAARQKPSTINSKESILENHLRPLLGRKRLDEISEADIQTIRENLRDHSHKTANNVLSCLSKLLRVAVKKKKLLRVPVAIELFKTDDKPVGFYEFEDYRQLEAGSARAGQQMLAMVLLGGDAGLRGGEMRALSWEDVDLRRRLLTIQHSEWYGHITKPKGGKMRRIPMTRALTRALKKLPRRSDFVLTNENGSPVSKQTQRTWMLAAQKAASLRASGSIHILRHTFCSHLAMRGAPLVAIRELAGHSSLRTTLRYMHLAPSERNRAIDTLDEAREFHQNHHHHQTNEVTVAKADFSPNDPAGIRTRAGSSVAKGVAGTGVRGAGRKRIGQIRGYMKPITVARLLRVGLTTVYRLIHEGPLEAVRISGQLRIHPDALDKYIHAARVG